jgi:putative endonuclease
MREPKQPATYIMASKKYGTLYIGVTSRLPQRTYEHRHSIITGFTSQYHCTLLVYYETFPDMEGAITREKQLKGWVRKKKITLIESINPEWKDLYEGLF